MSMRRQLTYRTDVAMAVVTLCIQVYLLRVVWTTVYGGRTEVASIAHDQAIAYALLAACLQTALMPWTFSSLAERVRGGQVGVDMTRPIGLIAQVLAQNVGTLLARVPVALTGLLCALALGGVSLLPAPCSALIWPVSLMLGVALSLLMNLLVSLSSFWSLETGGYLMLYRLGSALASGALVPLWFMPPPLARVLDWLPFRAQVFTPLSIYLGQVPPPRAWLLIAAQAGWLVLVIAATRLVWMRAQHKVVVFGG